MVKGNARSITKNLGGRPTAITDDVVRKLEDIFKIGGTVSEACNYAGISRETYYYRVERDPGFLTKMQAAMQYSDVVAKNLVVDSIVKKKDLNSAKWWLEKRVYKNQPQVAVQVNTNVPVDDFLDTPAND